MYPMINLSPVICQKLKEARREAGLSQSIVAKEVGCKQSALSMFEQGDGTKLNDEVIKRLAEKFDIKLDEAEETTPAVFPTAPKTLEKGFCPNPHCPSNHGYKVGDTTFLKPARDEADPVGGKFCVLCGEVLEKKCPNCGGELHDGAVCTWCGSAYVAIA